MKTATIKNDYHNTTAQVRYAGDGALSAAVTRRVRATLCGISGCTCGGNLGERGPQDVEIEAIGMHNVNVPRVAIRA